MITYIVQLVAITAILVVFFNFLYVRFKKTPNVNVLLKEPTLLVDNTNIAILPKYVKMSDESYKYSLCFWLYSPLVPENGNWKSDFETPKGIISHSMSPNVTFEPQKNQLNFKIGYLDNEESLKTYNINVYQENQRWNHYCLSVFDTNVNIYKNGIIIKSAKLPYPPWFSQRNLYIGQKKNNSMNVISYVSWANDALDSIKVESLYNSQKNYVENESLPTYVSTLQKS